ncbi:FecR family protein [Microbulbifer halophilus]|uniref:FecR family protein n=1 Tax=Microbulbifer halophilus TaxID=453963 RepID=A0ABW5EJ82_9GAMM|nr:FecR domain-containing protein [Microbulbifer halophilus]MCW8126316.1 FecR domain-containing protein [Microbulbifer halophilus]
MNTEHPLSAKEIDRIYDWAVHGGAESADAAARERHENWLREKPARLQRARQVEGIWNHPDFENAVRLVGSSVAIDTIPAAATSGPNRKPWYLAAAAAFLIAVSVTLVPRFDTAHGAGNRLYTTERQQTSRTALADGSTLDLSARSRVAVDFTERERRIRLYDGEARFTVAKDRQRPFVVESHQASIEAVGTIFNVDQRQDITELTVLEGSVAVHPLKQPGRELQIAAGERLRVSANALGTVQKFDPDSYKSWLQGLVEVEDMRLEELLVEFNRYSARPLVAGDHRTRNLRVSGTFNLNEIETNLHILSTLHGLEISEAGEEIVLQTKKTGAAES